MADVTVYVDSSRGNDSGNGLTQETAKKYISSAMKICENNEPVDGHKIYIAAGEYTNSKDVINLNNIAYKKLTFYGTGIVTVKPAATIPVLCSLAGLDVSFVDLIITAAVTNQHVVTMTAKSILRFLRSTVAAPEGHQSRNVINVGSGECHLESSRVFSSYWDADERYSVLFSGDSSGSIVNSIIVPSPKADAGSSLGFTSSGAVEIKNSIVSGAASHGIICNGDGQLKIQNTVIGGCGKKNTAYTILKSKGTLSLGNCHIMANPWDASKIVNGTYSDLGGNTLGGANPKYVRAARNGYIMPTIDDAGNFDYALSLESALKSHGMTATYFYEGLRWSPANNERLKQMVSRGTLEAGTHTYSHVYLRASGKLWDLSKGSETFTVDRSANKISISGGGEVVGFKEKTLEVIKQELEGLGAVVTPSELYSTEFSRPGKIFHHVKGEVIADVAAGNAVSVLVDTTGQTGLFKAELKDPKEAMEAIIGNTVDPQTGAQYRCNSVGCPYNAANENASAAAKALGFTSMRGLYDSDTRATPGKNVYSADIYKIYVVAMKDQIKGDGSEETIRKNSRALAFASAEYGLIVSLLLHTAAVDATVQQWEWMLDEFAKFGTDLHVCSQQKFVADVKGAGWTESGGKYYKTLSFDDADYHLLAGSPLIDKGSDVGVSVDYAGAARSAPFDIGPFEFAGAVPPPPEPDPQPGTEHFSGGNLSEWVQYVGNNAMMEFSKNAPAKLLRVQIWNAKAFGIDFNAVDK